MYCDKQGMRKAVCIAIQKDCIMTGMVGRCIVIQHGAQPRHGQPGRDTAQGRAGGARAGRCDTAAGATTRPGAPATTLLDPPTTWPHACAHARPRRACARRLGVLAGPSWCTVHLAQFCFSF